MGSRVVGDGRSAEKVDALAKAADNSSVAVLGVVLDVTDRAACEALVSSIES